MKQSGIYDYRVMEFGSLETIMGCVSAGMGKTFLPLRVAEKYSSSDIKFSKLSGEYSNIPTHVVCLESALPLIDIDLILEEI
jgi:DNA-binding transcriptional LysR family regulator